MLCANCKYVKSKSVGFISSIYWCGLSQGSTLKRTKLGVQPWRRSEHPKCPLKNKRKKKGE